MPLSPGMLRHHVPCGELAWIERYNERQHAAGFHEVSSLAAEKGTWHRRAKAWQEKYTRLLRRPHSQTPADSMRKTCKQYSFHLVC